MERFWVSRIGDRSAVDHLLCDGGWRIGVELATPIAAILNLAVGEFTRGIRGPGGPIENFTMRIERPKTYSSRGDKVPTATLTLPIALLALNGVNSALALQCDLVAAPEHCSEEGQTERDEEQKFASVNCHLRELMRPLVCILK
jgi:hypothetical protein